MFLSILSGTVFVPQYLKTAQAVLVRLEMNAFGINQKSKIECFWNRTGVLVGLKVPFRLFDFLVTLLAYPNLANLSICSFIPSLRPKHFKKFW